MHKDNAILQIRKARKFVISRMEYVESVFSKNTEIHSIVRQWRTYKMKHNLSVEVEILLFHISLSYSHLRLIHRSNLFSHHIFGCCGNSL